MGINLTIDYLKTYFQNLDIFTTKKYNPVSVNVYYDFNNNINAFSSFIYVKIKKYYLLDHIYDRWIDQKTTTEQFKIDFDRFKKHIEAIFGETRIKLVFE